MFDKLVQSLAYGGAYGRIADSGCSATTIRTRRDEWTEAGVFADLEQICLNAHDWTVGLELSDLSVDGCIVKAPCGGEAAAGRSPVDRGRQGTKRSLPVDGAGIPLGCVIAGAHRNDSPLLRPTLETVARFDQGLGSGLPEEITIHLEAGYDSTKTRDLLTVQMLPRICSAEDLNSHEEGQILAPPSVGSRRAARDNAPARIDGPGLGPFQVGDGAPK